MLRTLSDTLPTKQPPKLLDRMGNTIRAKHYSLRTQEAYSSWIKRFIIFHGKRLRERMVALAKTKVHSNKSV